MSLIEEAAETMSTLLECLREAHTELLDIEERQLKGGDVVRSQIANEGRCKEISLLHLSIQCTNHVIANLNKQIEGDEKDDDQPPADD